MSERRVPEYLIEENQIIHDLSLTAARIAFANRHGNNRELTAANIADELRTFYLEAQFYFDDLAEKNRQAMEAEREAEAIRTNELIMSVLSANRKPT